MSWWCVDKKCHSSLAVQKGLGGGRSGGVVELAYAVDTAHDVGEPLERELLHGEMRGCAEGATCVGIVMDGLVFKADGS